MLGYIRAAVRYGKKTETADTAIVRTIPPHKTSSGDRSYTRLTSLFYRCGTTAHTLTVMRPLGTTTLSAAALAAQAVINLVADPGSIAANDYLVIEKPDGTFHTAIVSSVATLAITLTANVPTGGFASGAKVWFMGVAADQSDDVYELPASTLTKYEDAAVGFAGTAGSYEPLIVYIDNGTAAGFLQQVCAAYTTL
jgi:hypothetical protein